MATPSKIAADTAVLGKDVAELALDTANDVVEVVETQAAEVVTVVRNNPIVLAGVAVVSLGIGGFAGYKFAEKKLKTKFDEILENELEATKKFYEELSPDPAAEVMDESEEKWEVVSGITETFEPDPELVKTLRAYHRSPVIPSGSGGATAASVLVNGEPLDPKEWGDNEEVDKTGRTEDEPFLISFNEYHESTHDYDQVALTFYMRDNTLADESDNTIENLPATIGVDNFHEIKKSPKETLFVRNPATETDYEVAKYDRSYAQFVLGLDPTND